MDDLRSELTGNFEKVVVGLMMTAPEYDAYELHNAMKVSHELTVQTRSSRLLGLSNSSYHCGDT